MNAEFSATDLLTSLEIADGPSYDTLPFGVVKMTKDGIIVAYNKTESEIAGVTPGNAIGKHFFTQVAPCTNNFMVAERYASIELDEEIDYMFTYIVSPTKVRLRLLKSAKCKHQYLLVQKS